MIECCVSVRKEFNEVCKDYMERIMNEESDWNRNVKRDAVMRFIGLCK